ncbi:pancreatic triacylglycerol lipase-like [Mya arenaria]|uniref:pancreatic triacylglycerol lipase-like n=1 Tax=Mya arenaria TaxID=6604 RepID=UPI0022E6A153|nr:pancreatic triacylglycerol lipase-like [Mya arenaria]
MANLIFLLPLLASTQGFLFDVITNHLPHTVCYGDLGCFSNGPPFLSTHRPLSVAPHPPAQILTRFLLYTRENPTVSVEQVISADDLTISGSNFQGSRATKIIVHGFTHNGHRMWLQNMTRELLKHDDYNVIVVDWQHGATIPYEQATANTRIVGAQIAQLVNKLVQVASAQTADFHIIGHSLGAHICGYAGERIPGLGRITGMDPAGPYFENTDIQVRLDPSDADFVDIIHTDGGGISNLGFGVTQELGHVDFYPNGGVQQPGCATDAVDKLGATSWTAITHLFDYYAEEETLACSHERSYMYFTESINSQCPFTAWQCKSKAEFDKGHCVRCTDTTCAVMGMYADKSQPRGVFYLDTEATPTFCEYTYQLNISSVNKFDGVLLMTLQGTNGTIGPIQLMKKNEVHLGSEIISLPFRTRVDVGDAERLTLQYEKINTPFISGTFPDDWHLLGISLFRADQDQKVRFCGTYHAEIDNHNATSFAVRGTTC